ncbi:MAG: mannosyltransferase, partial [Flavobacteriales bacterium]|nr:mannosyltransferase [Flavobacteriales bacterium]
YFLLSTTVHPWYITTLVALSAFTKYQYASLWSFLVLLSYAAYAAQPFQENFYLLGLEYLLLAGFIAYELWRKRDRTEV